ncbi:hypothetical protein N7492_003755 [Penicillium capsulatum]|uniref:Uncharacterized protein n=1 Tax=Penicillium capsulatum TaxID=69766 RepID=A0A9W9IL68_9EURO|nr:hypothetical protein N7492_003755 [Penicillium capsulatum]KAJ6121663.1 hypothetical protein N7512_004128 [Penicillium capsulatum]
MDAVVLHCIICPEQPNFSDVSHLLTHVASKAHLSNYFKLQVRSHQDALALELLQEYDAWYQANNLSQLLSDRMTSKEARRKKRKGQASPTSSSSVRPPPTRSRGANHIDPDPWEKNSLPNFLDPRLVATGPVKCEGDTADEPFVSCYVTADTSAVTGSHASSVARAARESTPSMTTAGLGLWDEGQNQGRGEPIILALPVTPKPTRTRNRRSDISLTLGSEIPDPFVDNGQRGRVPDDAEADRERAEEIARLKGILWPGMDIFDSATQQMRRKRNQKKDGNVLKMMEITSLLVEPTELVFSPTGILRRERVISGKVDDDSPLKGETPIPTRRPTRPKRNVLQQIDPNILRVQDKKRPKIGATKGPSRSGKVVLEGGSGSPRGLKRLTDLQPSYTGLESELELSVRNFGKRNHGSFAIFSDDGCHGKQSSQDQHIDPTAPRETLTPARLMLDRKSDALVNHGSKAGRTPMGKENIEPILNPRGQIGFQTWASPLSKRSGPIGAGYAPRYFFDEQPSTLAQADDGDRCGYQPNPLLAPSFKAGVYANRNNNFFDENVTATSTAWAALSRAVSDDVTVSDEDHDLAQLYLTSHAE